MGRKKSMFRGFLLLFVGLLVFGVSCNPVAPPPLTEPIPLATKDVDVAGTGYRLMGLLGPMFPILYTSYEYRFAGLDDGFATSSPKILAAHQATFDGFKKGCAALTSKAPHTIDIKLNKCPLDKAGKHIASGTISVVVSYDAKANVVATMLTFSALSIGDFSMEGKIEAKTDVQREGLLFLGLPGPLEILAGDNKATLALFRGTLSKSDGDNSHFALQAEGDLKRSGSDAMYQLKILDWEQQFTGGVPYSGYLSLQAGVGAARHNVALLFRAETAEDGAVNVQVGGLQAGVKSASELGGT